MRRVLYILLQCYGFTRYYKAVHAQYAVSSGTVRRVYRTAFYGCMCECTPAALVRTALVAEYLLTVIFTYCIVIRMCEYNRAIL